MVSSEIQPSLGYWPGTRLPYMLGCVGGEGLKTIRGQYVDKKTLRSALLSDLERSGLDEKDARRMRLEPCNEEQAQTVLNTSFATDGYVIPYFQPNGKLIDAIRFRFLNELLGKDKKPVRYSQPKGTDPHLYYPPCTRWGPILKDPNTPFTLTEGEKKAYKACKEGIPTIGLGGVWSFKCKRLGKALIDDFESIQLSGRTIYLCFDSDARSNTDVQKALRELAAQLDARGAHVYRKNLPFSPYHKIGLDDYLLEHSPEDYAALEPEPFIELNELAALNDEVAYIREAGKFYIFDDDLFVGADTLVKTVYPHLTILDADGKRRRVAQQWVEWPNRREHRRLTYSPGEPRITERNEYNLWRGWGCEPKRGSVKPFMDAVRKIFGGDKELIQWFLDWVAYPIQHPGTKMLSAVLLQSIGHGTGKSSIGLVIGAMYGENFTVVEDGELRHSFNEWAVGRQFVMGDEILGTERRKESDRMKNLVTRESITINEKYKPSYKIKDTINYLFTSNHPDPLQIEPDDRRFFVHSIRPGQGLSLEEGRALEAFRKGAGRQHLLYYFAKEHKLSKHFDHRARPPMTAAKEAVIDHSLTDLERFLMDIKRDPQHGLSIDGAPLDRDLFTLGQVVYLYERAHPGRATTTTAVGKALNKIFDECPVLVANTKLGTKRLRALRNMEHWRNASHREICEHFNGSKVLMLEKQMRKRGKYK